jgi:hypothetical protein
VAEKYNLCYLTLMFTWTYVLQNIFLGHKHMFLGFWSRNIYLLTVVKGLDSWMFIPRDIKKMTIWSSILGRAAHKDFSKFWFEFFWPLCNLLRILESWTDHCDLKEIKNKRKSNPANGPIFARSRPLMGLGGLLDPATGRCRSGFMTLSPEPLWSSPLWFFCREGL